MVRSRLGVASTKTLEADSVQPHSPAPPSRLSPKKQASSGAPTGETLPGPARVGRGRRASLDHFTESEIDQISTARSHGARDGARSPRRETQIGFPRVSRSSRLVRLQASTTREFGPSRPARATHGGPARAVWRAPRSAKYRAQPVGFHAPTSPRARFAGRHGDGARFWPHVWPRFLASV